MYSAAAAFRMSRTPVLIVMALPVESQGVFERAHLPVLYTGVGKVNAAASLARHLTWLEVHGSLPRMVVNFGTAGSRRFDAHTIVGCRQFRQRDMDASPLGFPQGETPYDELGAELVFPIAFPQLPEATCCSGDSFVVGAGPSSVDVMDMEGYALAKVCRLHQLPFACAKYITDGADPAAAGDWLSNLPHASTAFLSLYRALLA